MKKASRTQEMSSLILTEYFFDMLIASLVAAAGLQIKGILSLAQVSLPKQLILLSNAAVPGIPALHCGVAFLLFAAICFLIHIFPVFIPAAKKWKADSTLLNRRPALWVRIVFFLILGICYGRFGLLYPDKSPLPSVILCIFTLICLVLMIRQIGYIKRNSEDFIYFEKQKKTVLLKAATVGICLVGLPLWIPYCWGFVTPQPLILEQKDLLGLYVSILSLTFVSISVMSMLSDRSIIIYWENIATKKLIRPVFSSFAAYTYYSIGAAMGAGISVILGNSSAFLVFCLIDIATLVLLTHTMVDVYYDRDGKKSRMVEELREDALDYQWLLDDARMANSKHEKDKLDDHRINKEKNRPYTQREIRNKEVGCQRYKEKIMLLKQNFARACEEHDILYLREVYELYLNNADCFDNPDGERIVQMLFAEITTDTRPLLIDALTTHLDKMEAAQSRKDDPFAPYCISWEADLPLWKDFTKSPYLQEWFLSANKDSVGEMDLQNFIIQVIRRVVIMYNDMVTHANLTTEKTYDYLKLSVFYSYLSIKTEADEYPRPEQVEDVFSECFGKMIPESMFPATLMLLIGIMLESMNEYVKDTLPSLFYTFKLPHEFTPYLGYVFPDETATAAQLWKKHFPNETDPD